MTTDTVFNPSPTAVTGDSAGGTTYSPPASRPPVHCVVDESPCSRLAPRTMALVSHGSSLSPVPSLVGATSVCTGRRVPAPGPGPEPCVRRRHRERGQETGEQGPGAASAREHRSTRRACHPESVTMPPADTTSPTRPEVTPAWCRHGCSETRAPSGGVQVPLQAVPQGPPALPGRRPTLSYGLQSRFDC